MNLIKINRIDNPQPNDNLIILSNKENLAWADGYLTPSENAYLSHAAHHNINPIFFPKGVQGIIIHFVGSKEDPSQEKEAYRMAGNEMLKTIAHHQMEELTLINKSQHKCLVEYLEGMLLGSYKFIKYFKTKNTSILKNINVVSANVSKKALDTLNAVIVATYKARDLVNEPQSYLTAEKLGEEVEELGKTYGFSTEILDKPKLKAIKMGGILAVNKGSFAPPRFCVLEWKPSNVKNEKPIILVGKGVVFDTGGVNLKPTPSSLDMMKCDMAGAATVIGTMIAVAKSNLPLHVIALVPATDNRIGNDAYLPGDVITMYDGTTVEVVNTDAEGRLILADALHYAKKYDPELVLDFATLTGAAVRSLGYHGIPYMGSAGKVVKRKLEDSGDAVYERLVEFPMWEEYGRELKSNVADLKNMGGPTAGMIAAAKFLEHFTDYPWLHFDIAGPAYLRAANGYRTKEGTGIGVRLLFDFLTTYGREKKEFETNGFATKEEFAVLS